jgi:glycosyltransferase involved in cell wall biosynthesis
MAWRYPRRLRTGAGAGARAEQLPPLCEIQRLGRGASGGDPADRLVGFNKMPGLDVYFAADPCYEDKARTLRNPLYRLSGRYRHFAAYERAVFGAESRTEILMISPLQMPLFQKYYGTPDARLHLLPPGIAADRRAPANAAAIRAEFRSEFGLQENDLLLLQIGSGFKTKGLDRSLKALAALPQTLARRCRLIAIGDDDPKLFRAGAALALPSASASCAGAATSCAFCSAPTCWSIRRTTRTPARCCSKRWSPACRC